MVGQQIQFRLESGQTPFGTHPVYSHPKIARLAAEEYARQLEEVRTMSAKVGSAVHWQADTPIERIVSEAMPLLDRSLRRIRIIEHGHATQLHGLALDALAELHQLDRDEVEAFFKSRHLSDELFQPDKRPNRQPPRHELTGKLQRFLARRDTHDLLTQGTGLSHMKGAAIVIERELRSIDPLLPEWYRLFSGVLQATNSAIMQQLPAEAIDAHPPQIASMRLDWDGRFGAHASAPNFAALVQEMSKAIVESNMAHGLPQVGDLSLAERRAFEDLHHRPSKEPWQFILGPPFAKRLDSALMEARIDPPHRLSVGQRRMYARTLFSLVPERMTHRLVTSLFETEPGSKAHERAVGMLKDALMDVQAQLDKGIRPEV